MTCIKICIKQFVIIAVFFNFVIISSNTLLHRYPRQITSTKKPYFTTNDENNSNLNFAISVNEARLVACGFTEMCQKVEEFKITENSSYNCFDKYLPIVFNTLAVNRSKLPTKGFLEQHSGHIHLQQSHENVCRKIKRFYVHSIGLNIYFLNFRFNINDKITIFTIDESIHITERTKVNKVIEKELYLSYEYWILFLFKLGIYDEQNDDILYFKAIKVFLLLIWYFSKLLNKEMGFYFL